MALFFIGFASADTSVLVGSENRIDETGVTPRAMAIVDVGVADHVSVTATFGVSPKYSEAYVGPTWNPTKSFSLGVAGGIEAADAPWRVMTYSSFARGNFHALGIAEYGGSGLWYKAVATYDVGLVSLGALAQRFDGVGPRVAVSYAHLELWSAPLYDFEADVPDVLVGLSWKPKAQ